ncbi:signal recognition particle-docking protein FtsY [Streptococcus sp.]|uniref:signal recognition particle-docking protein FtsY n=1 Tax=Streptococcus sp. TaxID=1306 RepID=UPI00359F3EEA
MALFDRLFGAKPEENLEESALVEEAVQEEDAVPEILEETDAVTEVEPALTPEQEAQKQRTLDLMERYYAEKAALAARVQEAQERGEDIAIQTKEAVEVPAEPEPVLETDQEKYERSLEKTRKGFGARLNEFFANFRTVDEEFFEELEELLILSDVGVQVASTLAEDLRYEAKLQKAKKASDLQRVILEKLVNIYEKDGQFKEAINMQDGLTVMLFVGVNGVGKTTSIGKLAYKYRQAGKKVMLVAADTFRAGAVAQLVEWGRRVDVPVVTGPEKSDPASVVFDGMEKAISEDVDILMIDTAGRLQNKDNLMAELEKIGRIVKRVLPDAPHETLLAVDASTGQNALVQAKEFSKITPLTGLVLTKIDGTARGGVVLAIRQELDIPVKFIGFGEKIDDIGEFSSEDFMRGLLEGLV